MGTFSSLIALPCGHLLCRSDFDRLGGEVEGEDPPEVMLERFFPNCSEVAMGGEEVVQVGAKLADLETAIDDDPSLVARLDNVVSVPALLDLCLYSCSPPPRLSLIEKILDACPNNTGSMEVLACSWWPLMVCMAHMFPAENTPIMM